MINKEADIFCLTDNDGKPLQPSVQATVLAKYSRSPESARDILSKLTEEEADKFQEKWVVTYGHNCYSSDTEVLTSRGFINWSEVTINDSFASLNPETNLIEYLSPVQIIAKNYDGPMYRVSNKWVDLLVTPNHKMLVSSVGKKNHLSEDKYHLIQASEISGKMVSYKLDGSWSGDHNKRIRIGSFEHNADDIMALVGFFINNGQLSDTNAKSVVFYLPSIKMVRYLIDICDGLGFFVKTEGNDRYSVTAEGLGQYLCSCYSINSEKQIPKDILSFSNDNLLSLFSGLIQSEKVIDNNKYCLFETESSVLKDQISELALKIGYSASFRMLSTDSKSPIYEVLINKSKNNPVINRYKSNPQDCYVNYSGKVYCAELPRNHTLYVRRRGKCVWSGNSVAELASIPVCMEGISIVASKFIEAWQRPGYSEKSTRYQAFSRDSFITPPGAPDTMKQFASRFYDAYDRLMEPVLKICAEKMGKDPNDPSSLSDRLVKARAFDNLRYLLPAGTGTNVAINAYARDLRDMICHLRGSINSEFVSIGDKLHDAVCKVAPTLVKHTEPDKFELPIRSLGGLSSRYFSEKPNWYVDLYKPHLLPEKNVAQVSLESAINDIYGMSWSTFSKYMENRTPWQEIPKVFKMIPISFDIMMDYGAFRDLQRHRRCEQYVEPLTTNYGYLVPDDIIGSHIEDDYRSIMESIDNYDDDLVIHDMNLMQYMIPLGYLHRSIFQMDLRELYYIAELRTKPQGHISYRRITYGMYLRAKEKYPKMMQWCKVTKPDEIGTHN